MKPALVYLDIPKTAGTSHRQDLNQVFWEDSDFWYGLTSDSAEFDPKEHGSSTAIGGHSPVRFFSESPEALYTSFVRDPVERVVSFFNYCSTVPTTALRVGYRTARKGRKDGGKRGSILQACFDRLERARLFAMKLPISSENI